MEAYYEDGKKFVSYTSEELQAMRERGEDKTDWARVGTISEEKLQALIAADPDDNDLTDEEAATAHRPNLGEKPPGYRKLA